MSKREQRAWLTRATSTVGRPRKSALSSSAAFVLEVEKENRESGFALVRTVRGWAVAYKPVQGRVAQTIDEWVSWEDADRAFTRLIAEHVRGERA